MSDSYVSVQRSKFASLNLDISPLLIGGFFNFSDAVFHNRSGDGHSRDPLPKCRVYNELTNYVIDSVTLRTTWKIYRRRNRDVTMHLTLRYFWSGIIINQYLPNVLNTIVDFLILWSTTIHVSLMSTLLQYGKYLLRCLYKSLKAKSPFKATYFLF